MTYKQFLNRPNIIEELLLTLNILDYESQIIRVDNYPDYDISDYKREIITDYFFHNSWDFSQKFHLVLHAEIVKCRIYHSDHFYDLSTEYDIEYSVANSDNSDFLLELYKKNADILHFHGFDTNTNDFNLHHLRIKSIDNFNKKLNYEGSFLGNNEDVQPLDWGIYALLKMMIISQKITNLPFYKTLISESYLLFKENKLKLSYFLAYSAFESFVNYELGNKDEKERLKDKITQLFKSKFGQIDKHNIYTSIMNKYEEYTKNRNIIAHGREDIDVSKTDVLFALQFILILISSYELNCTSFDDLSTSL